MLNPFYWYSSVWILVFSLYMLGLSDYCISLGPQTIAFFLISIIVSIIAGKLTSNKFQYKEYEGEPRSCKWLTILIIILGILNFAYGRDIPLISIITGRSTYSDFHGIPLLYTVYENLILANSAITSYLFIETNEKKYLRFYLYMVILMLLMFHKGIIAFCTFSLINVIVAKLRSSQHKLSLLTKFIIAMIVILLCYLNGGLTNLRSGSTWNDKLLVEGACKINERWPSWLPIQFAWAYTYLVSPLANLNINIVNNHNVNSITGLIGSILPDAFVKRFLSSAIVPSHSIRLITLVMNACSGFIESVYFYGSIGLWFYFISYFIIIFLVVKIRCDDFHQYSTAYLNILCMMTFVLFFYNTLRTAATSLLIYIILMDPLFCNTIITVKGRKI